MRHLVTSLVLALGCSTLASPGRAAEPKGPQRIAVHTAVTLPADVRHPEGLATNPANGDLYVGTFDAREPASARNNQVLRYSAAGKLLARYAFGPQPLTGLAFADGKLYILNFGASKLQRLDADFTERSKLEDVAQFGALEPPAVKPRTVANPDGSADQVVYAASGFAAINGMVFDTEMNLYVSDSFQGAIYRIARATSCAPCTVSVVSRDPLLATAGYLPFGANGLAFGKAPGVLYVCNAGDNRLLRMDLASGQLTVLAESLPGADGLMFHDGLLWIAANQADVVLGLDESGLVRVRAGEFTGIGADGSPGGLLFPASTAVSGQYMFVTNLALPLTAAAGDEWEERVGRWNLARFRLP
ncbi:SMP-30/gluconolactonase/LRE family protein [Uliginosibacterium sp. H1]|uniref:SMP-30/gluconolactonase/LRE family protein n=1 Tax=Uliginosibacterium sp. H1 TaxID=3114757 RepID=UPI002E182890|nr:hypothetical protein [Uliginosibacterium sp. H1]